MNLHEERDYLDYLEMREQRPCLFERLVCVGWVVFILWGLWSVVQWWL